MVRECLGLACFWHFSNERGQVPGMIGATDYAGLLTGFLLKKAHHKISPAWPIPHRKVA